MICEFKVKPMFEGQYHQRHQFSLKFEENTFQGIFKNNEIQWFHPLPRQTLHETIIQKIESRVNVLMAQRLEYDISIPRK